MRRVVIGFGSAIGLLIAVVLYAGTQVTPDLVTPRSTGTIYIDNVPVEVVIADTEAERTQGLSGRPPLAENEGMFFVFDEADRYGFWMKDMRFAIDMIWLSDEGFVVDIHENVQPGTYPQVFRPQTPALYVLEVRAGFVHEHGIGRGSRISF